MASSALDDLLDLLADLALEQAARRPDASGPDPATGQSGSASKQPATADLGAA